MDFENDDPPDDDPRIVKYQGGPLDGHEEPLQGWLTPEAIMKPRADGFHDVYEWAGFDLLFVYKGIDRRKYNMKPYLGKT